MTWTRAHDAWIARECEGMEIQYRVSGVGNSGPVDWCFKSPMPFTPHGGDPEDVWVPIKTYSTDPAACIRAAEAWRKKETGRSYQTCSQVDNEFGTTPASAVCRRNYLYICGTGEGDAALAQALYRATGGSA